MRRRKEKKESLHVRRKVRPERVRRKGGGSLVRERIPERARKVLFVIQTLLLEVAESSHRSGENLLW